MKITHGMATGLQNFLKHKFADALEKNSNYTLRAFARDIGVDPGTVSRILSGKQTISSKRFESIAKKLNFHPLELKDKVLPSRDKVSEVSISNLKNFKIVSNWYHDAILEMTHLEQFQPCPKWVAKQLELPLNLVRVAIERLIETEQLVINVDGTWEDKSPHNELALFNEYSDVGLRKYQKQILNISAQSIDQYHRDMRNHTSTITSIDQNLIPELNKKITAFQKEIINFIENKSENKNAVIGLQFSHFPLVIEKDKETL